MESARRRAPSAKPVSHRGIRYEQMRAARSRGFEQSGGILVAVDERSGQELWTLQIFKTAFEPHEERDAQEIYLSEIKVDPKTDALLLKDERNRKYRVDLSTRSVELLK